MDLGDKEELAKLALLAMYAEDMHRDAQSVADKRCPPFDARFSVEWEPVAYLWAEDSILPPPGVRLPLNIIRNSPVYYGILARRRSNPQEWVVAVRGTAGVAEWIIDGQFLWVKHPDGPMVEHGFWDIYSTMQLMDLSGASIDKAAAGIKATVGDASHVAVVGHSLGSALATYLSFDLAKAGVAVQACMFASPRTGDQNWADLYHQFVSDYIVVNYALDVVPHLPTRPNYSTLKNLLVLQPDSADASIRIQVGCNHHVICYCAMLSYETATSVELLDVDVACRRCVVGDRNAISQEVRSMAAAVTAVADSPSLLHVSALFRAMFGLDPGR